MAQKTYLQLVNEAMAEAKVSVDQLNSGDFLTNDSSLLYGLFRAWVNQAYEELLMERPEWHFRNERAVVSLHPRLYLGGVASTISAGDTLEGASSGTIVTVVAVHTSEEAEFNGASETTVSVTVDADSDLANLILRESFNRTAPTVTADIAYFIGAGRYDLKAMITGLSHLDEDSLLLHRTAANAVTEGDTWRQGRKLTMMDWAQWSEEFDLRSWGSGEFPRYMSRTPDGLYALYPMPDSEVLLTANYTQGVQLMDSHDDVPLFPAQYHTYIMWKTVEKFADWDRQGALFMRAAKNAEKYRIWMERDLMPAVSFTGWNGAKIRG